MAIGIKTTSGEDLDIVFKARTSTKISDVGIYYNNSGSKTDISNRYEGSIGGDQIASDTGIKTSGGTDLKSLFQDIDYVASGVAPTVSNPAHQTVSAGSSATFSVTVTGTAPFTYQWKKSTGTPVDISGATSSSYTISVTSDADEASYFVTVTNAYGFDDSTYALLTVETPPSITAHPTDVNDFDGASQNLVVFSAGDAQYPNSFQWEKWNGSSYVEVSGATSFIYIYTVSSSTEGQYRCRVSNIYDTIYSNPATVTMLDLPIVTSSPSNITATAGDGPLALQCSITAGSGTNYFSWYRNGSLIAGPRTGNMSGTQDQHVFNPILVSDSGTWICKITTSYGADVDSSGATVSVTATNPTISAHPSDISGAEFEVRALECTASVRSAESPVYFSWYRDGSLVEPPREGNLSATQDQHVFAISSATEGSWVCVVTTDFGGSTSSSAATVTMTA